MNVTENWMDFVYRSIIHEPAASHAQERKFMEGLSWKIPGGVWQRGCRHKLSDLGYSNSGTKMTQLTRDYMNLDDIELAHKAFHKRKDQSVTTWYISTIGAVKTNAQGHCIRGLVLHYTSPRVTLDKKPRLTIDIVYRTTELLRKFGADLIFLTEILIPKVLEDNPWGITEPDEVRMYFSSCFFSALFIPVFFQYVDATEFLSNLYLVQGDSIFYRRCVYRTKTMLEKEPETYKFASRKNMSEFAHRLISSGNIDKQKIQEFLKKECNI